ncbi:MAG: hypothetical protein HYZ29_23660 [Myxococcales bacterium]|nr:hypothetical protein [Myxococcales bacterium]
MSDFIKLGLISCSLGLVAVAGCAAESDPAPPGSDDEVYEYVPEGKADDYRSTTGLEYSLTAKDSVTLLDADLALTGDERLRRAEELIGLRFKALSFFVFAYLADKEHEDPNYGYGGFRTTVRQKTFDKQAVVERTDQPGTFDYVFEAEVGGPKNLMALLPLTGGKLFDLKLPKLTTAELESQSYSTTYKGFDPSKHPAESIQTLGVEIAKKPIEPDAYPEYSKWMEDGVLDIAIHIGGDYNEQRYDLQTAKDVFARLQSDLKLTAPVAAFDQLKSTSGPFKTTLDANGKPVEIQVFLFHPDMAKEEGVGYDGLISQYKASAKTRDIVIYDGHAGYDTSYSGIVVHYNPRVALKADDFASLELPAKHQLFFFNGCKTYTSYADAMYANPAKSSKNLEVITTVNFSWLSEMTRVTSDLVGHVIRRSQSTHAPMSYDRILAALNAGRSWDVIYGVHGLSDNPRLSPYADPSTLCQPCTANGQCPGVDNLCVKLGGAARVCAAACTDDSGCPSGYKCRSVAAQGSGVISQRQCVAQTSVCQ